MDWFMCACTGVFCFVFLFVSSSEELTDVANGVKVLHDLNHIVMNIPGLGVNSFNEITRTDSLCNVSSLEVAYFLCVKTMYRLK